MLRLSLLTVLGMALLPRPFCTQEEFEPNGSTTTADAARTTLPVWPPVALCGEAATADEDYWRIPLDFHTTWLCEGEANFKLDAGGPCRLTLMSPQPGRNYKILGSWHSASGHIETGQIGVLYYRRFFNHLVAIVEVEGERAPYRFSYW
jgi:hypothetical protein